MSSGKAIPQQVESTRHIIIFKVALEEIKALGFQTPWVWRYLDPKNLSKRPTLRRYDWKTGRVDDLLSRKFRSNNPESWGNDPI